VGQRAVDPAEPSEREIQENHNPERFACHRFHDLRHTAAYIIVHNSLCLETGFDEAELFSEIEKLRDYDFSDYGLNTEKYITSLETLQRKELAPVQKAHYLISIDVKRNDSIIDIIAKLRDMEGVEVRASCN
jgi:hypothetical protein